MCVPINSLHFHSQINISINTLTYRIFTLTCPQLQADYARQSLATCLQLCTFVQSVAATRSCNIQKTSSKPVWSLLQHHLVYCLILPAFCNIFCIFSCYFIFLLLCMYVCLGKASCVFIDLSLQAFGKHFTYNILVVCLCQPSFVILVCREVAIKRR